MGSFLVERSTLFAALTDAEDTGLSRSLDREEITQISQLLDDLTGIVLARSAAVYEQVVRQSERAFCQIDKAGNISYVNSAMRNLCPDEALFGRPFLTLFAEKCHSEIKQSLTPHAETSPAFQAVTLLSKTGDEITLGAEIAPLIVNGEHIGGYARMVDITAPNRDMAQIMEHLPMGIIRIDTERTIMYINKRARDLAGATEEILGKSVDLLFPPGKSRDTLNRELKNRFESGLSSEYPVDIRHQKENRLVPIMIASTPVRDAHGKVVGSMALIRSTEMDQAVDRVNTAIVEAETTDTLLETVCNEVHNVCPNALLVISQYSRRLNHSRTIYVYPKREATGGTVKRWWVMPKGIHQWLVSREDDIIDDFEEFISRPEWAELKADKQVEAFVNEGLHSCLRIPVWDRDEQEQKKSRLTASISLFRAGKKAFSKEDKKRLNKLPLGKSILAALHLEEKKRMYFRFDLFKEVINHCHDLQKMAEIMTTRIADFYQWNNVSIFRIDEKEGVFRLLSQKAQGDDPRYLLEKSQFEQPLNQGLLGYVWKSGKPVFSGDVLNEPNIKKHFLSIYRKKTRSEICMPFNTGDKTFWLMNIEDPQINAFSSDEIEELEDLHEEMLTVLDRAFEIHLLHETLQNASDGIIVADCLWRIRRSNPSFQSLSGYSNEELRGLDIETLLPDRHRTEQLKQGSRYPSEEVTLKTKSGNTKPILLSATALPPEIGGTILILKDMSLVKRLEELDYLGKLYYEIAIQTKTPLSLLFSWIKRMKRDLSPSIRSDLVDAALQQLRKLTLTFDRLALYDKRQGLLPPNPVLMDVGEIIEILQQEFPQSEWNKIVLEQDRDIPLLRGDIFQLTFCLESILSYLLRGTSQEGRVRVVIGREDDMIIIRLKGVFPEFSENTTDRKNRKDAILAETLADMALGEKVIEGFISGQGGSYNSFRNGPEMQFDIMLKPAA